MARCTRPLFLLVTGYDRNAGKTTLTCSIIRTLRQANYRVSAFKLGADPVDASLLSAAAGNICFNLDPFLMSAQDIKTLLYESASENDFIIIESTLGIQNDITDSFRHLFPVLTLHIEDRAKDSSYIARFINSEENSSNSEIGHFFFDMHRAFTLINRAIKAFFQSTSYTPNISASNFRISRLHEPFLVAVDQAFGTSSQNNFHYLLNGSAKVESFSPLRDKSLTYRPASIYLGSGNISPYLRDLSKNTKLMIQIKKYVDEGTAIYAEGDAIAYLFNYAIGQHAQRFTMLGLLPGFSKPKKHKPYGYCLAQSLEENILCRVGDILPVYYDSDREVTFTSPVEYCFGITTPDNRKLEMDGVRHGNIFATNFRSFWGTRTTILK